MSANCLKTQLKSVVENDELNILGVLKLHITAVDNPTGDTQYIMIKSSAPDKIKFVGGVFYSSYGGTSLGDEVTLTSDGAGNYQFIGYYSNNNGYIALPKYTILSVNGGKVNKKIYLKDVDFTNITEFDGMYEGTLFQIPITATYINYSNTNRISGRIGDIPRAINLTDLRISGSEQNLPNVEADDIARLGKQTAVTTLAVPDNTYGTIEAFVAAQRANGRTSCNDISMPWIGATKVTFNDQKITAKQDNHLSWTSEGVITLT